MNHIDNETAIRTEKGADRTQRVAEQRGASFKEYAPGDRVLVNVNPRNPAVPGVVESWRRSSLCATVVVRFADGTRSCIVADRVKEDRS